MELLVVRGISARRVLAGAIGLAGIAWAVAWGFNAQAAEGSRAVLGLAEGEWRAVLNPALGVLLIGALTSLPTRSPAGAAQSGASVLILAGLALILFGNVAEFGLLGDRQPTADLGWSAFAAGALLAATGVGALAAAMIRLPRPRPALRLSLAMLTTIIALAVAVAVPAAMAILATGLMDALLTREPSVVPAAQQPVRLPAPAGA